jgi:hypothetical protein
VPISWINSVNLVWQLGEVGEPVIGATENALEDGEIEANIWEKPPGIH